MSTTSHAEHHIAADHAAEVALLENGVGEEVEMGDRRVVLGAEFVDREELLVGGEVEVPGKRAHMLEERRRATMQGNRCAALPKKFDPETVASGPHRMTLILRQQGTL